MAVGDTMHGVPPPGASRAAGRGLENNGHPTTSNQEPTRPSKGLDTETLGTMNGTLRDSCERIRDRVAELAGTIN